jgi:hypothetical protein
MFSLHASVYFLGGHDISNQTYYLYCPLSKLFSAHEHGIGMKKGNNIISINSPPVSLI